MEDKKKKYEELCLKENIPLFSQYFWMDAVCGKDNWDVILIEENGCVVGSLVYFLNKVGSSYEIRKAPLTQHNGIIFFEPPNMKYERKLSFQNRIAKKIISEIEKLNIVRYRQYFHHSFTNWLPFFWAKYQQTTRYTYIIEDTQDMEHVYNNFKSNIRGHIRKAEKNVEIFFDMDPDEFYILNKSTFERQGLKIPYDENLFKNLYTSLKKNNNIYILYAKDENGNVHAGALFAHDKDTLYYLMSGTDEKFRESQALSLIIYEGIKLACNLRKKFDFEGSMKENIELQFRHFGAIQKPYFDIKKEY